jgi:Holliday junction DNA helicase RuvA
MIHTITGIVRTIQDQIITIDAGFMGFGVQVPNSSLFAQDEKVQLYIHLHWNQENGPSLFGFKSQEEKMVFLLAINCQGVGPKLGLAILADLGVESFLNAIAKADERALSQVSGIGAKKAEQIIVALKHKVAKLIEAGTLKPVQETEHRYQVAQALKSLNYSKGEITAAMNYLGQQYSDIKISFDQLMRHALSYLAKKV